MSTTTSLDTLKINYLTQAQYDTALANNEINENEIYMTPYREPIVDLIYPVGSIYMSVNNVSPATFLEGTTWEQIKDRFLLSAGASHSAGSTGGNESVSYTPSGTVNGHTLTIAEMPSHTHTQNAHHHATDGHVNYNTGYTADSAKGSGYRWGTSKVSNTKDATATNKNTGGGGSHSHGFTGTAATIETMPPYLTVYMWKRTA